MLVVLLVALMVGSGGSGNGGGGVGAQGDGTSRDGWDAVFLQV